MKPIIFSTPMVQAILDGKKTQTRRVVKINGYLITSPKESLELTKEGLIYHSFCSMSGYYKPLCQPGDILWVRETWAKRVYSDNRYYYKADDNLGAIFNREGDKWRPSIFMPREAARIFLKVTNVRVERLQEITAEDVIREGIKYSDSGPYHWHVLDTKLNAWINFHFHDEAFKHLWDSLNAKRGYGWDMNPWVWVIEFEATNSGRQER